MFVSTRLSARRLPRILALFAGLSCLAVATPSVQAQAAAPAFAFGSQNVGASASATVTFTFSASTTVASVSVVTQGATGLDFQPGTQSVGACAAGTYMANATCTVAIKFSPTVPGQRLGAALLLDSAGNKLGAGLLFGTGNGAHLTVGIPSSPTQQVGYMSSLFYSLTVDAAGNVFLGGSSRVYASQSMHAPIYEFKTDGTVNSFTPTGYNYANEDTIGGEAVDGAGYLYASDESNGDIYKIDPVTGASSVFATISNPIGLAFGPNGTLYVGSGNTGIQAVSPSGTETAVSGTPTGVFAVATDPTGTLYYVDNSGNIDYTTAGGSTGTITSVGEQVLWLAVDPAKNIFLATQTTIKEIRAGTTTAISIGASAQYLPFALDSAGNLYQTTFTQSGSDYITTIYLYNRNAIALQTPAGTATAVGAKSASQSVTAENDGNAAAAITSFSGPGAAEDPTYTCSTSPTVAPGGTCTLGVQFAPTAHGSPQTGTLLVNGSNFPSPSITITGYVTGDPVKLGFSSGPPATLQNGQNAGTVTVAVQDNGGGSTISTASVTLTVTSTSGYSATYTVSAVNGTATFNVSAAALATGTYTYTASSTGLTSVSATEVVYPYKLVFTAPPATPIAAGGNAGVVQVAIRDNSGNATAQTTPVTLNVSTTGYSASYGPVTPANGTATFDLSGVPLTVSGSYTYTASATGLTSGMAPETVTPGPATHLAVVPANASPYVGQPDSITVTALDTYGNVATSDNDTTSLTSSDSKATLPANFALASGNATVSVKFGQPGTFSLNATDTTTPSLTGSVSGIQVTAVPSYTVTTLTDDNGSASAANCSNQSLSGATPDSSCSLRDAIAATNALNFTGTTNIQPTIGFASTLSGGTATMAAALNPTANVSITGPGAASLTIAPTTNYAYNAFTSSTGSLAFTLSGVTVTGFGIPNSGSGAALYFDPASASVADLLTFNNDTFSNNGGTPGANTASNSGGALYAYYSTLAITGSTFTGNSAYLGGAVSVTSAPSVTITGSTFGTQAAPNRALSSNGAALLLAGSAATISTSTFAYNTFSSTGAGGAINTGSPLTLNTDVFLNNAAGSGGAVYSTSTLTVAGSTFNNNTAKVNGGAIYATGLLTVSGSSFMANQSGSTGTTLGGAIYDTYTTANASITSTNFLANRAVTSGNAEGGALYVSRANLTNVLFSGNYTSGTSISYGAAAFYTGLFTSTFTGVTFTGNSTTGATTQYGGAVYAFSSTLNLYNTTVTGNSAKIGGGIYKTGTLNLYNSVVSGNTATGTYPDIYPAATSASSSYAGAGTSLTCTANCTPLLSALGAYGGGTVGAVVNGVDYTTPVEVLIPLPGSPLLAAGSLGNVGAPGTLSGGATTDARGTSFPRTVNGNVDIGAAEANYTLAFVRPPGNVETGAPQSSTVQVLESGNAFVPGVTGGVLALADSAGYASPLSAAIPASGAPTPLSETYSTVTTADTLSAKVQTSTATTLASVTSGAFNVVSNAGATFTGLQLSALPATSAPATAQTVTVTALDANGAPYAAYTGTVTFTSTDAAATLPAAYTFTAADAGVHTFTLTFNTRGRQTLTVTSDTNKTATASTAVVMDYIWLVNATGTVDKLNESGAAVTGAVGMAASTSTKGGVAFDASGNVWSVTNANNTLNFVTTAGASAATYTGGGLSAPVAVAVDGLGSIWIANSGNSTVSAFLPTGAAQSPTAGYGTSATLGTPSAIAIDNTGGVWVTGSAGNSVTHVFGAAAPVTTPTAAAVTNSTVGARP